MTRTCEHSDAGRAAAIELSKALSPPKSRGRGVRRCTPGSLAAFRRGVADCHSVDAPTVYQGYEILEHSFVPMRRGVRPGGRRPTGSGNHVARFLTGRLPSLGLPQPIREGHILAQLTPDHA